MMIVLNLVAVAITASNLYAFGEDMKPWEWVASWGAIALCGSIAAIGLITL